MDYDEAAPGDPIIVAYTAALVDTASGGEDSWQLHLLRLECLKALTVAGSTQLYLSAPSAAIGIHPLMETLFISPVKERAPALVGAILRAFIARPAPPRGTPLFTPPPAPAQASAATSSSASIVGYVSSATVSLFTAPYRAAQWMLSTGSGPSSSPLADAALLLLLTLLHQPAPGAQPAVPSVHPFRQALVALRDAADVKDEAEEAEGGHAVAASAAARVPYSALYTTLSQTLTDEKSTLLLYSLLQASRRSLDPGWSPSWL